MDVIANNIANVNTVGFKSQRATFADAFYQRIQGASGPDATTGRAGVNPQQIGLGLNLASIDNIMTQGATQRTDRSTDVTLTGPGFLIVQDSGGQFFTRAGNIGRDFQNNLHINGMQLMGWSTHVVDGRHVVDRSALVPLSLGGDKQSMPAEPTSILNMVGNLNITQLTDWDPDTGRGHVTRSMAIYDSLGNRYLLDVRFTYHRDFSEAAASPHGYWTFEILTELVDINTGEIVTTTPPPVPAAGNNYRHVIPAFLGNDRENPSFLGMCLFGDADLTPPIGAVGSGTIADFALNMVTSGTIAFNSRGEVIGKGVADVDSDGVIIPVEFDPTNTDVIRGNVFDHIRVVPVAGVAPSATFGDTNVISSYSPTAPHPSLMSIGNMTFNMSELFQRGGNTTMRVLTMDGGAPGDLVDLSIGGDGTIMGRYSNGRTRVLGQIPLALFQNPEGLERVGANLWVPTANSGAFDGVGLIGSMQGGALEMSNVDLANEFTEMITTQRGFQAASRTITVSDEMLQELVNLRR